MNVFKAFWEGSLPSQRRQQAARSPAAHGQASVYDWLSHGRWSRITFIAAIAMISAGVFAVAVGGVVVGILGGRQEPSRPIEKVLATELQLQLSQNKQKIFDSFHPVGTAKSIKVHEVTVDKWRHGQRTNRREDIREFTVRYTLYWEGWITTNGYTKINQTYDAESGSTTQKVLDTNGITHGNVFDVGAAVLGGVLQYQAQKAGAEQAAQEYLNRR